jgi:NADH-quinone oxidoreductase subunit C
MAQKIIERLLHHAGPAILAHGSALGNEWVMVDPAHLVSIATFLRDERDLAMDMPIDCTAVDYLGVREPRFEVVWHLYSTTLHHRLRIKVALPEQALEVPALTPIWPGMNWHEREAWDLYGVRFVGHPDLRRVLMYEEFEGHPLRRDYAIDKRQPLIEMREVRPVPTQRHAPTELLNRP